MEKLKKQSPDNKNKSLKQRNILREILHDIAIVKKRARTTPSICPKEKWNIESVKYR